MNQAFSLVEVLVVVTVIALLLTVLLPGLRSARNQGKRIVCLSNMRQLGQFTVMYNADFTDRMPRSTHSATARGALAWGYAFYHYATSEHWTRNVSQESWAAVMTANYRCPFDRRKEMPSPFPFLPPSLPWSYGYNVYFELSANETPDGWTWRLAPRVPRPGSTVLFGEIGGDSKMPDHIMAHFWTKYNAPSEVASKRHQGTSAYVYLDAHAENLRFEKTYEKADENSKSEKKNQWNPARAQ